jgi:hypothetical protein
MTRLPPPMLKSMQNDQISELDLELILAPSSALIGQHLPYISYLSKSCIVVVRTMTRLPTPMLKSMQNDQNLELNSEFDSELRVKLQIKFWLSSALSKQNLPYISYFSKSYTAVVGTTTRIPPQS